MNGLKYISWHDHSGYSVASRRYLAALIQSDVPLTWTPMVPGDSWGSKFFYEPFEGNAVGDPLLDSICNREIDFDTVLIHLVPEYYPKWREQLPGKRLIGMTTWETDRLPAHWPAILNDMDEIWVCSTWNQEVFRASGVTVPVRVVPHIFEEPSPVDESEPLPFEIPVDHTVFYNINVWTERKALAQLLEVYWSTFRAEEPVTLLLKTSHKDQTHPFRDARFPLNCLAQTKRTVRKLGRRFPNRASTVLLTEEGIPQKMIDSIHTRGDIYISLSHAEGWGLGVFDAIAAGNPVITPGYGGPLDYLNPEYAAVLKHQIVEVKETGNANFDGPTHHRAEADSEHTSEWMRRLFEDRKDAQRRGRAHFEYTRQRYHAEKVLQTMLQFLKYPDPNLP